jgi:alkylation response protein AidB-like acyl-CoA dehydrogenase
MLGMWAQRTTGVADEERDLASRWLAEREVLLHTGRYVIGLQIACSNACNFSCAYCFADAADADRIGLLGVMTPEEYGGTGQSSLAMTVVLVSLSGAGGKAKQGGLSSRKVGDSEGALRIRVEVRSGEE